ncbi:MAG: M20/M25/M40 family metallo-hydrolase [Clostridia bacterium]
MKLKDLCEIFTCLSATAGDEFDACNYIAKYVSPYITMKTTKLGSLVGQINPEGKGPHILIDAHIDQVGLIVRGIDEKGFILFDKLGGIDERVLVGSEVIVRGKEYLYGIVCSVPPHLSDDSDKTLKANKMAIDIGYDKAQSEKLVEIGDRVILNSYLSSLLGDKLTSPALDDRSAMAAIVQMLPHFYDELKHCKVTIVFSSQEEVGCRGAKTALYGLEPDYAIAIDVGFGYNNNCKADETIKLGGGVSIGISPVLDRKLGKELVELCKEYGLKYQHDVMPGRTGTNADEISIAGAGVKTALLSIPLRNMHTAVEVVSEKDLSAAGTLFYSFIMKKEAEFDERA